MGFEEIVKRLRPLRNRIQMNHVIQSLSLGLAAAGAVSLAVACGSLVFPVPYLPARIGLFYAGFIALSLLVSVFLRPGVYKTLKTADALGLKERLITAYQLREDLSSVAQMQRKDALDAVADMDFKASYALKIPGKILLAALILMLLTVFTFAIPAPAREEARATEELRNEIAKRAETIEARKKELEKSKSIPKELLEAIDQRMEEMLRELTDAKTGNDALKALARAKHDLEELKPGAQNQLNRLADSLSQHALTKEWGQAVKDGKLEDMKQKMEQLLRETEKLDATQREQLAEQLKKAAEAVKDNSSLAEKLSQMSQAVDSGDAASVQSNAAELQAALESLAHASGLPGSEPSDSNPSMQAMLDAIDAARYDIAGQIGELSSLEQGEDASPSGNPGDGQGEGQGQSGGQNQGQGSGGAGDGTSGNDGGYRGSESSSGARAPGEGAIREYEEIYVPERLGDGGQISQVKGRKGNMGQSSFHTSQNLPVDQGSSRPYNEVFEEYRREALTGLDGGSIPPVMKDIVRDYFTSLE